MSNRIKQGPDGDDLRELLQLLMHIFEMVRRLPPGPERVAALEQIRDFQTRLRAILERQASSLEVMRLTIASRREQAKALIANGMSPRQAAKVLGVGDVAG